MFPFDLHGQPMRIYRDPAYPKMYVVGALLRNAPNAPKKKCKNSTYIAFKSSYSRVTEMVRFFSPNDKWNINTTVNYTCVFHNQSPFVL